MSNVNSELIEKWTALKVLVESLEIDVHKGARGNKSAAIRTRKGLRLLKKNASDLVKSSLDTGDDQAVAEE